MRQKLAPFLTTTALRRCAEDCLEKTHPSASLPIPIDEIIEGQLDIEIVPFPELRERRGVEGYVSRDRRTIYVDHDVFKSSNPNRYRFTLAHELSHVLLHEVVFKAAAFDNVDGWIGFLSSGISPEERRWIEWHANCMAGYLLVPPSDFAREFGTMAEELRQRGVDVRSLPPQGLKFFASKLGERFQVSAEVIRRQGVHEGVWRAEDFPY